MSMHLEGPWLSTTGKKKGKKKFASAEHARKARELAESWASNKAKWDSMAPNFSKGLKTVKHTAKAGTVPKLSIPAERNVRQYPSLDTGHGNATKAAPQVYTGDKIVGIATMHKSNMVPVFSNNEAKEIATMRRN